MIDPTIPTVSDQPGHHQSPSGSDWLSGGGEMGALIQAFDWSKTPVGPLHTWPQSLRTALSICLCSRFPMAIWWGPEIVQFYNDGYRPFLGIKHPRSLGQRGNECWKEIWDVCGPLYRHVMRTGESTWSADLQLLMDRNGYVEETYFTFAYSPIRGEMGDIQGNLITVTETTERVIGERRLKTLRDLGAMATAAKTPSDACRIAADILAVASSDIPFAMLYLLEAEGRRARLFAAAGFERGVQLGPETIDLSDIDATGWPINQVVESKRSAVVDDLSRFGKLPTGPWADPPHTAIVLPLTTADGIVGAFVAGISPRHALDDTYRGFVDLLAGQIATAVSNARAYEEERKRAEALAELDRAKTTFFSNVSHEFRTPLTLMLGPLEDELRERPCAPRLELAHRNSLRLLKLVNTLLDFSRIEAGRMQAYFEPTDLAAFTTELASLFRSAIERAGLRLIVDCPPLAEPVYVDRGMWEKVVLNLISNALKFTFDGEIAVSLRLTEGTAELRVRDTGEGIPAEDIQHLFQRFYRVQNIRSRTHEGTGIGLALVHELAKLHGGMCRVESQCGKGSTFIVTVPCGTGHLPVERIGEAGSLQPTAMAAAPFVEEALRWQPDSSLVARSSSFVEEAIPRELFPAVEYSSRFTSDASRTTRPVVLIVDDNADMRAYLCRLLTERYEVMEAADGEAALAAARRRRPDLILTDVMMPRLDGLGLLGELRSDLSLKTIPVIVLSARAGEESRVEGLDRGADDYLVKPFSARELLARVAGHVDIARVRREAREVADKANAQLAAIVESSDDAIVGKDLNGVITSWNAGAERLFGYTAQEAVGRSITMLMPPERVHEEAGILERIRRGERIQNYETVRRRKDGELLDISLTISPIINAAGMIVGVSKIARNIAERKRQEEDLVRRGRQQRLLYELANAVNRAEALTTLYDTALDAIVDALNADRAAILLFGDGGVMRFMAWRGLSEGYRRAVEGHSPWQRDTLDAAPIVVGNVEDAEMPADLHAVIRQEGIGALSFIPLTYSGRLLGKFMVYFNRPHTMNEEEVRLALAVADTLALGIERRKAEEALRRLADELEVRVEERTRELITSQEQLRALATELNLTEQRERRRLAGDLHDYLAQLLALTKIKVSQVKQQPVSASVAKGLNEIQEIMDQTLVYTRTLVAQLSPPVLREFGLVSALTWLSEQMKERDLTVELTVEGEIDPLPEDQAMLLFQSVRELLINVIKHGATHQAMVTVSRADATLRVAVADNGSGFDLAAAAAAAAHKTESSPPKFGLFSIRERMKALGGDFHIVSSPGQGTTATLVLPLTPKMGNDELGMMNDELSHNAIGTYLQRSIEARHAVPHNTASNSEFTIQNSEFQQHARVRVLLVDDHAMVRQGLRGLLEGYSDLHVIGEAGNGEDAVSMGTQLRPHVVLMDVNMPKMDGIEAARRLRQSHPQVVIIGLSVDNSRHIEQAMREAGAAAFHSKEAAVEELYVSIQAALGKRRAG